MHHHHHDRVKTDQNERNVPDIAVSNFKPTLAQCNGQTQMRCRMVVHMTGPEQADLMTQTVMPVKAEILHDHHQQPQPPMFRMPFPGEKVIEIRYPEVIRETEVVVNPKVKGKRDRLHPEIKQHSPDSQTNARKIVFHELFGEQFPWNLVQEDFACDQ
ncbi:hypothetical protein D3C86_1232350 [compost metagenome]